MTQKIALVTGGSRGIGAEICKSLANNGYKVIFTYVSSTEKAEKLAKQIGGDCIKSDVSDDKQASKLFEYIKDKYKHINILINNAGTAECEDIKNITKDSFMKTIKTNLWGPVLYTNLALNIMDRGCIIYISSVCAELPTPDAIAYSVAKAGLNATVRNIAAEVGPNIRVNAIAPSATDTELMRKNYTEEDLIWVKENYPMKNYCDTTDIANMVEFLVSDKAKNITGQIFTVDAGCSVKL